MRVLFQSRSTLFTVPGGDTIQMQKTAEALRALDVAVDISTDIAPSLANYDLVHIFNLTRPQEAYLQARHARRQGRPVALSTIYVDYSEYERRARRGLAGLATRRLSRWQVERLKVAARALKGGELKRGALLVSTMGFRRLCSGVVDMASVLLPNSASEMERVRHDFSVAQGKPFVVVTNAVDGAVFDPRKAVTDESAKRFEGCVLSVGRIEGLKCQLELVHAVRGLDVDLVLIGSPAPNHLRYYNAVRAAAGCRVHFIPQLHQTVLAQYYAVARVHALVSWMETTGLSSLEAAAMGCNVVVTNKGDTRAYFNDDAFYCDPGSVDSIRTAITNALVAPVNFALQSRVRAQCTWKAAAEQTLKAYRVALAEVV